MFPQLRKQLKLIPGTVDDKVRPLSLCTIIIQYMLIHTSVTRVLMVQINVCKEPVQMVC